MNDVDYFIYGEPPYEISFSNGEVITLNDFELWSDDRQFPYAISYNARGKVHTRPFIWVTRITGSKVKDDQP